MCKLVGAGLIVLGLAYILEEGHRYKRSLEGEEGEQALSLLYEKLLPEIKSCFKISKPHELRLIGKTCKMNSLLNTINDVSNRSWISSGNGFVTWYEDIVSCKLNKMAVKHNYSSIDVESYREKSLLDKWTGNSKDLERYKNIFNSCSQNVSGETAFKQVMSIEKCVSLNMIKHCDAVGAKSGISLTAMYSFSTLMDESPCKPVRVPEQVKSAQEECMNHAIKEYEAERNDEQDLQELSMEDALKFVGDFFTLLVDKTTVCTKTKLGFYNNGAGTTNFALMADFVEGFSGWENITEKRDVIIEVFKRCSYDDYHPDNPSDTDSLIEMMLKRVQFDNCFLYTLASTCGLNNDLAALFFPILDTERNEMFVKYFRTLKNPQLDKHLKPYMEYFGEAILSLDGEE